MKFIKGLFLAFVFSCIFAVSGANAVTWFKAYGDIQIPALQGIWGSNDYTKCQMDINI